LTNALLAVGYGNGLFIAVGEYGTIVTSPDGTNWVQRQSGTTYELRGIAYGNGQFVAVGNTGPARNTIVTSTDGVNWIQRQDLMNGLSLPGIAYGNGQFVVVARDCCGYGSPILTSTDGVKWVGHQSGLDAGTSLLGLTYGNGHFVAVGDYGTILESGSIITLALTPKPSTGFLSLSLEGPTGLGYTIQSSTDLISWRDVTNFISSQPMTAVFDLVPGSSDRVFYRAYPR
jgi:hypothetical protein